MSNTNGNIVAFFAGTAIGVGLGILFAPDKGSNTRGKMKDGLVDWKDQAKSKLDSLAEKAKGDLNEKNKRELKERVNQENLKVINEPPPYNGF